MHSLQTVSRSVVAIGGGSRGGPPRGGRFGSTEEIGTSELEVLTGFLGPRLLDAMAAEIGL